MFSASEKLQQMCSRIDLQSIMKADLVKKGCGVKHINSFTNCRSNVVYCIPLSCGRLYIGQTGRCLNVHLREHYNALNSAPGLHLSAHCSKCGCVPKFSHTFVLYSHYDTKTREIVEAFFIKRILIVV